jgi:HD-GYP domain-containing protein (c-di-GMP phosphodiesterase class II)
MTKVQSSERLKALQEVAAGLISATSTDLLFEKIVDHVCNLMVCDAASFYLFDGKATLSFLIAKNCSVRADFRSTKLPVDGDSLAAFVYRSAKALIVHDVYEITKTSAFRFNPRFDERIGYRSKSMLTFPLSNRKGEVLGVIQAINKKNNLDELWPSKNKAAIAKMPDFDQDDIDLMASLAAIASASLENAKLYEDIENLFDGFVRASVHAIESRDLTTLGHSERVTLLTIELAKTISESTEAPFEYVFFGDEELEELRYATLLHDFGKISVPEYVIQKEEKLSPLQKTELRIRVEDFKKTAQFELLRSRFESGVKDFTQIEIELRKVEELFEATFQEIIALNKPTILDEDKNRALDAFREMSYVSSRGQLVPLLTPEDIAALSVKRGSLSDEERQLMQDHVEHSYRFLKEIPWTAKYRRIPDIARSHHELLDGTGYPLGLKAEDIPLKVRIMTICDIFDALVANDRAYKSAVPIERAISILQSEADRGRVDADVLRIFCEAKIYLNPRFQELVNGVTKASEWKKVA